MEPITKPYSVNLVLAVITSAKHVTVFSPHLAIYAIGKTQDEAIKRFDKSLRRFYKFHETNKNLHSKLISLGWKKVDHTVEPPLDWKVPTNLLSGKVRTQINHKRIKVPAYASAHC